MIAITPIDGESEDMVAPRHEATPHPTYFGFDQSPKSPRTIFGTIARKLPLLARRANESSSTLSPRFPAKLIESRRTRQTRQKQRRRSAQGVTCSGYCSCRTPDHSPKRHCPCEIMITVVFSRPTWYRGLRRHPKFGSRHCPPLAGKRRNNKE